MSRVRVIFRGGKGGAEEGDEDEGDAKDEKALPLAAHCPEASSFAAFSSCATLGA